MELKTLRVKNLNFVPENYTGMVEYPDGTKEWYKEGKTSRRWASS